MMMPDLTPMFWLAIFALEQAKKHSSDLIEKWLCEYKFKDWKTLCQGVQGCERDFAL
jgi:hypothetical protein